MSSAAQQLALTIRLRERAVFDSYVPSVNIAAVEQLRTLARAGQAGVVWLSGPSGVGKSHLLQASCALARSVGVDGVYLPLVELVDLGPEALEGWQRSGIVALDDVDAIAGRADWERAVFRLYREVQESGAPLLAAADEVPQRLPFSLPDLASRFAAASLLPLRPLDEAGQREALQLRARARGLELPQETALYLQRRFRRDLPTLYQLLDAIDEASLQAQRRLTVPFIRQVLAQTSSELPE
ncbi:MAG: DnaA regulatory inactivator Hda [Steroidobacteraceae bacterium]